MWMMEDGKVQGLESIGTFYSVKSLFENDCAGERLRLLAAVFYSGRMGAGKGDSSQFNNDWNHVVPGSIGETNWKIACGKIKLK
jgi:hypothetical protein